MSPHLWLRAETKENEKRTALTPSIVTKLLQNGFKITIEESDSSIFESSEYSGVDIMPAGSWVQHAPMDAFIIGLKELPNDSFPLAHKHIMFAHCYKSQDGWKEILNRFDQGNGSLYDLEFLNDDKGRRVAAFGYYAGFAGAALGIEVWCHKILNKGSPVPSIQPFKNVDDLISHIKARLALALTKVSELPRVMVMGALGRCGTGACDLASKVGIPSNKIVKWDVQETMKGGPFKEIVESDIFVNCIYLSTPIPPFLTLDLLDLPSRTLSVLVDVSCDPNNPHNPLPVYNASTTFNSPTLSVETGHSAPLDIIAIDHLPTLLPREASDRFCEDLYPSLLDLARYNEARVWTDAKKLFDQKIKEASLA